MPSVPAPELEAADRAVVTGPAAKRKLIPIELAFDTAETMAGGAGHQLVGRDVAGVGEYAINPARRLVHMRADQFT